MSDFLVPLISLKLQAISSKMTVALCPKKKQQTKISTKAKDTALKWRLRSNVLSRDRITKLYVNTCHVQGVHSRAHTP